MGDEQTRRYYRRRAPEYEQIYYRDNPPRRKEIDDEAAFLRGLADGREVLDLGCGTGYWTQILAERAALVAAADIAPEIIAQAGRKEYRRPPHFLIADLEHPPFAEGAFDLVVLAFWLSHQPRETFPTFFPMLGRLVRRGGRLWMIDNNPPAEGRSLPAAGVDAHGNNFRRRFLDNGEPFVILKNYFQRDELVSLCAPYGRVDRLVYGTYYWSILLSDMNL